MAKVRDRMLRALGASAATLLVLGGCSGSGSPSTTPTTAGSVSSTATTAAGGTAPTVPVQTSGPRTVLSPIGLNVRAAPAKSAAILGSAAQGATLTVLGHTDEGGGWYQVKGATVTGYITDDPVLSADGKFTAYSSTTLAFGALYPETWTPTEAPPNSVVFRPPSGSDSIVVTTAATTSQLGRGRAGYHQESSDTVVVCGVTGQLVTLTQVANAPSTTAPPSTAPPSTVAGGVVAEQNLVQIRLTLDAKHALGVEANLADLTALQQVKDVIESLSFPFPQCQQGTTPPGGSTTAPPTTVH